MDPSVYARPKKPKTVESRQRGREVAPLPVIEQPEVITVGRETECFVTPPDNADFMVECLGPVGDYLTLEPHAGTGNLIQALYDAGHSRHELVAVERSVELCNFVSKRFTGDQHIEPLNECFLEYTERAKGNIEYPRIIMNPPFKKVRAHMNAAISLLGRGGHECATLVALVPITYKNDEAEVIDELGPETFATVKVNTKIVRIVR